MFHFFSQFVDFPLKYPKLKSVWMFSTHVRYNVDYIQLPKTETVAFPFSTFPTEAPVPEKRRPKSASRWCAANEREKKKEMCFQFSPDRVLVLLHDDRNVVSVVHNVICHILYFCLLMAFSSSKSKKSSCTVKTLDSRHYQNRKHPTRTVMGCTLADDEVHTLPRGGFWAGKFQKKTVYRLYIFKWRTTSSIEW